MYAADLQEMDAPGGQGKVIAIGWLEPGNKFARGQIEPEFVKKLCEMLAGPWQNAASGGRHWCGFCRWSGGPSTFQFNGTGEEVRLGVNNLWVPSDERMYLAPSLVLHYIDAHHYAPPKEFRLAVMKCPPMRSMAYLKAVGAWKRLCIPELKQPGLQQESQQIATDSGGNQHPEHTPDGDSPFA